MWSFFDSSVGSSALSIRVKSETSMNSSVGVASNFVTVTLTVRVHYYYPPSGPDTSIFGLSFASSRVTTPLELSSAVLSGVFLSLVPYVQKPWTVLSCVLVKGKFNF